MTAVEDDFPRRLDRAPLDANRLADRTHPSVSATP